MKPYLPDLGPSHVPHPVLPHLELEFRGVPREGLELGQNMVALLPPVSVARRYFADVCEAKSIGRTGGALGEPTDLKMIESSTESSAMDFSPRPPGSPRVRSCSAIEMCYRTGVARGDGRRKESGFLVVWGGAQAGAWGVAILIDGRLTDTTLGLIALDRRLQPHLFHIKRLGRRKV